MVPNRFIAARLEEALRDIPGLIDGEVVIPGMSYNDIQSVVMSESHSHELRFAYAIFDYAEQPAYLNLPYKQRLALLEVLWSHGLPLNVYMVQTKVCNNPADVESDAAAADIGGYEGLILRSPNGIYKQGRSTLREQIMLKYVEYTREEALVNDVSPAMENLDAGNSKKKENLVSLDRAGTLHCWNEKWGYFDVGSGWTHEVGRQWLASPLTVVNKRIVYKYKPYGCKDKPRQPVYVGFRTPEDL
jgi:DNA ligase-1